jgi:4-aminobutyrate aminotransferase
MGRLREMQEKYEAIGDVRGIGLMVGVELIKTEKLRSPQKTSEIKS